MSQDVSMEEPRPKAGHTHKSTHAIVHNHNAKLRPPSHPVGAGRVLPPWTITTTGKSYQNPRHSPSSVVSQQRAVPIVHLHGARLRQVVAGLGQAAHGGGTGAVLPQPQEGTTAPRRPCPEGAGAEP